MTDNYWIIILRDMVKIAMFLTALALLNAPAAAEKYGGQIFSFAIPEGWRVLNESNETKIILSDDLNSIEIESIEIPENLSNAMEDYDNLDIEKTLDAANEIFKYYLKYINKTNTGEFGTGGLITFHPDGVEFPTIGFNYGPDDPIPFDGECYVTWAKPEYVNKMIGVHALFPGNTSKTIPTGWPHGSPIPEPLFVVLKDFEVNLERTSF